MFHVETQCSFSNKRYHGLSFFFLRTENYHVIEIRMFVFLIENYHTRNSIFERIILLMKMKRISNVN